MLQRRVNFIHVPIALSLLFLSLAPLAPAATAPATGKQTEFYRPQASVKPKTQSASAIAVVNAASYLPGISPGGLITIFGQNLSNVNGIVYAGTDPLPTQLAGVTVVINGYYAPIYGVAYANGEDQISVQVPYEVPVGPGVAQVQVYNNGVLVASVQEDSFTEDPGIFMYNSTYAVAVHEDYTLIGPSTPAFRGEVITLYTTGLGPLSLNLVDGYGAPSNPLAYTQDPFSVLVNGESCQVLFSGLAPGFVGLYQLNIVLPSDLPRGNLDIQIVSPYASSGVATLPVN